MPVDLALGEVAGVTVAGVMSPRDGDSWLRFDGVFQRADGAAERRLEGWLVPLEGEALIDSQPVITPEWFGVQPGIFDGTLRMVNVSSSGDVSESEAVVRTMTLVGPSLRAPDAGDAPGATGRRTARGEWLGFTGRGLIDHGGPTVARAVVALDGTFTPGRGVAEGWRDVRLVGVGAEQGHVLSVAVRPNVGTAALGLRAGYFEGRATPVLVDDVGEVLIRGESKAWSVEIEATHQRVKIVLTDGFFEGLTRFGLEARWEAVAAKAIGVAQSLYPGLAITFALDVPEIIADFTTVELRGDDPNGLGLFGLDATAGKDTGNLSLDELIGGFNQAQADRGQAAWGGIFVSELLGLSPTVGGSPLADADFDARFGPVMPALGGTPVGAHEGESEGEPQGARAEAIRKAEVALGTLIGGTLAHEVGHVLGLSATPGAYHNPGDGPGYLMDEGHLRPFAERVGSAAGPTMVISPDNMDYLQSILALPSPRE